MAELKSCPFCGSIWTGVRYMNNPFDEKHVYGGYAAYCDDCCVTTKRCKTEAEAVELWNRRFTVETNIYDQEETYPNCTVQVLTNTATGEVSVGWWENGGKEDATD